MQNGMITAQLTPHNRLCFVPTSKNLIPPSKSGKTSHRLARRLVGRQVCRLGGGGGCCCLAQQDTLPPFARQRQSSVPLPPLQPFMRAQTDPNIEWVLATNGTSRVLSDYFKNELDEEDMKVPATYSHHWYSSANHTNTQQSGEPPTSPAGHRTYG